MKEKKKHTSVALVVIVLAVFISMCGIMFAKGKKDGRRRDGVCCADRDGGREKRPAGNCQ